LRDFTVDDALIPARYATHIAQGFGYRFNATGVATDGVTPLGWPYLLAPFAFAGPLEALAAASIMGAIAWLLSVGALGASIGGAGGSPMRFAPLLLVACSAPLAAWSVAGLETGVVTALATVAAVLPPFPRFAAVGGLVAGACAWLRPEMLPFAVVLGVARSWFLEPAAPDGSSPGRRYPRKALPLVLAIAPWLTAVLIRLVVWGRPYPLAVLAKPSDLEHGAVYAAACFLLTGAPITAVAAAGLRFRALDRWAHALALAASVHWVVVVLVGGDWMPLSRLVVPVLPMLVLVASRAFSTRPAALHFAALALGLAGELWAFARAGPAAATVGRERRALIDAARAPLSTLPTVAALDIGWVGAATTSQAEVIDLAGLTDPEIAALSGGHTSKQVSLSLLLQRKVDAIVLLLSRDAAGRAEGPAELSPEMVARAVEARLLSDPRTFAAFSPSWTSPAGHPIRYVLLTRRVPNPAGD
jgi:hypothetical protein